MKKYILLFLIIVWIMSCSNKKQASPLSFQSVIELADTEYLIANNILQKAINDNQTSINSISVLEIKRTLKNYQSIIKSKDYIEKLVKSEILKDSELELIKNDFLIPVEQSIKYICKKRTK